MKRIGLVFALVLLTTSIAFADGSGFPPLHPAVADEVSAWSVVQDVVMSVLFG